MRIGIAFVQELIARSAKMLRRRRAMLQTHWFSRAWQDQWLKIGSLLFRFRCAARLIITGADGLTCTETC
jgi:hypothetical protein